MWYASQELEFFADPERRVASQHPTSAAGRRAVMDAVTNVPTPVNEPVRQYPPGSADRAVVEAKIKELAGEPAELTMTLGGRCGWAAASASRWSQPHNHPHVLGHLGNATDADVTAAIGAGGGRGPRLAGAVLRRPGRDLPEGSRPAGRAVAGHDQRGHHARPVQVGVPGRDRRGLRADRLLAVQRALRRQMLAEQPSRGRARGTGWSTGRSRASCSPSRRSTSPRSRATCRPRRP